MAFKRGGHSRPQYSISTSVAIRKGKYVKGPSFGLWDADSGPMARGSVKEDYLGELISFLKKAEAKDLSVSFALFKNKKNRDEDDGEDEDGEWGSKKGKSKRSRDDEDEGEDEDGAEEKEEKRESRRSSKSQKSGGKSSKKSEWDFDGDED